MPTGARLVAAWILVGVAASLANPVAAQVPALPDDQVEAAQARADALMAAWRAADLARVRDLASAHLARELATVEQRHLWDAVVVDAIGPARPTTALDGDLEFQFEWRATLDEQSFIDRHMAWHVERASAGDDDALSEDELAALRAQIQALAARYAERVAFSPQRFTLRPGRDGWRLHRWMSVSVGAEEPTAAAELFLAAFAARDVVQVRAALSPTFRRAFDDRVGQHLVLGSVVRFAEADAPRAVEGRADAYRVDVRWRVDFRPERIVEHVLEEARWERQFADDDPSEAEVQRYLNELRDDVERRAAAFRDRVGTFGAALSLERRRGQWYVADVQPREVAHDGGADSPTAALQAALRALRLRDFSALDRVFDPARQDGLGRGEAGQIVAAALVVERFDLNDVDSTELDQGRVRLAYRWTVRLDARALADALREQYRRHAREQGLADDAIDAILRERDDALAEYVAELRRDLEAAEQSAVLVRLGGRWYVEELVAETEPE